MAPSASSRWIEDTGVITHFLVHNDRDTVGVAVVEGLEADMDLTGWIMDTDETITITATDAIPLGHKIALADLDEGATVYKYGHDIGRTIAEIPKGGHVHVHNTKTKRW